MLYRLGYNFCTQFECLQNRMAEPAKQGGTACKACRRGRQARQEGKQSAQQTTQQAKQAGTSGSTERATAEETKQAQHET